MTKYNNFFELISAANKKMAQIGVFQSTEFQSAVYPFKDLFAGQSIINKFASAATYQSPLFEYGLSLERILNNIATIPEPFKQINEFAQRVSNEVEEAENNYIYNLALEELEYETKRGAELTQQSAELEQRIKELEISLKTILTFKDTTRNKQQATKILTLKPLITFSQIVKLHETSQELFEATLEQWCNLFSEEIKEFEVPITVVSQYVSDVRVLFDYLKKRELIDVIRYSSILAKAKVFCFNDKIITAKQLNKPTEYNCYPHIGNYELIDNIVTAL